MGNNKLIFKNSLLVLERNTFFKIWGSLLCFSFNLGVPGLKKVKDP